MGRREERPVVWETQGLSAEGSGVKHLGWGWYSYCRSPSARTPPNHSECGGQTPGLSAPGSWVHSCRWKLLPWARCSAVCVWPRGDALHRSPLCLRPGRLAFIFSIHGLPCSCFGLASGRGMGWGPEAWRGSLLGAYPSVPPRWAAPRSGLASPATFWIPVSPAVLPLHT